MQDVIITLAEHPPLASAASEPVCECVCACVCFCVSLCVYDGPVLSCACEPAHRAAEAPPPIAV